MPPVPLHIEGDRFRDAHGRDVLLRGVNLGGDSKVPWPDGGTDRPSDFSDHRSVSFVGRPFPLEESDEHFARLRNWGFNCIRLVVTWEAIEHAGPGIFDTDYLDYITEITRRAGEYGFYVFIDFHQDAWSRMSGGCGAPGWTFEAVGLDFTKFHNADAALVMQQAFDYCDPRNHQAGYPRMSWSSNYKLPANGIMWSLFFGGRWLTPAFTIAGVNVQDYLQGRYLASMNELAKRVALFSHVIGFESLNEPSIGWLGQSLSDRGIEKPSPLAMGAAMSPLDGLAVARGLTIAVPVLGGREEGLPRVVGERTLNAQRVSIWREGAPCPFEAAGIYTLRNGEVIALDERAFGRGPRNDFDVSRDVFAPFFAKIADTVRAHRADWILFAQIEVAGPFIGRVYPVEMPEGSVNAPHWYDLASLTTKRFDAEDHLDPFTGRRLRGEDQIRESYSKGLDARKRLAQPFRGPSLIGEIGVHFDLDEGAAFKSWAAGTRGRDAFAKQTQVLSLMGDALDSCLLSATWWNYSATNRNDARVGDGWNQEDLSIFSRDQQDGCCDGGRAVEGFARPFVRAAQGQLLRQQYRADALSFEATIEIDPSISQATEISLPHARYTKGARVETYPECDVEIKDNVAQLFATIKGPLQVRISPLA